MAYNYQEVLDKINDLNNKIDKLSREIKEEIDLIEKHILGIGK